MPPSTLIPWSINSTPVLNFTSFKPLNNYYTSGFRPQFRIPEHRKIVVSASKRNRSNPSISANASNRLANGVGRNFFPAAAAISRNFFPAAAATGGGGGGSVSELDDNIRKILQAVLWVAEGVYIVWLFLLPYAPGDPIWAISSETISSLTGLSINFFFILPLWNSVGIHLFEAPVLHPMSEGLFNFVIGWTFMFAPLLYTDKNRDRYKGSLDVLWGFQMFLTNTFLLPYMAIRLNKVDENNTPIKNSQLGLIMTNGAPVVGLIGGLVCSVSILWAVYGRGDGNFGDLAQRWEFVLDYLGTERLAYAFIWDICLYSIFQPWLIGENLQNIQEDKVGTVNFLRFVPFVGLASYCLFLTSDDET